jgi:hypothetical protein
MPLLLQTSSITPTGALWNLEFFKILYLVPLHWHLPSTVNSQSKPTHFADNTSINTYHPNSNHFKNCINDAFAEFKQWFKANKFEF